MFSWQGDRSKELMDHLGKNGALDENGNIKRDQNSLNQMAAFAKTEMGRKEYGEGRLNEMLSQPNVDRNSAADVVGRNYIKWRVDDPRYREGGVRNRNEGYDATSEAVANQPRKTASLDPNLKLSDVIQGDQKPTAAAVDLALRNEGMHEIDDRQALSDYLRKGPNGVDPARTPWCAAYVNSSLAQAGVKGSGSAVANSFQRWGVPVPDATAVEKGDVVVKTHGHGPDETGGHVGMATGRTRNVDGHLEVEMVSGNSEDAVRKTWEPLSDTMLRRAKDGDLPKPVADAVQKEVKQTPEVAPQGLDLPENKSTFTGEGFRKSDALEDRRDTDASTPYSGSLKGDGSWQSETSKMRITPTMDQTRKDMGLDFTDEQAKAIVPDAGNPKVDEARIPEPPNLETNTDPNAGEKLTASIKSDASPPSQVAERSQGSSPPRSTSGGRAESDASIRRPTNDAEAQGPTPGSDGYGSGKSDPDGLCALCAT
jgi:uncharacterized protein (TIGR02594 family)